MEYRTSDFQEAIFLRKSGIPYLRTEWVTTQRAVFIFRQPSEEVLSAWAKGDDGGVRIIADAMDFLRSELRGQYK